MTPELAALVERVRAAQDKSSQAAINADVMITDDEWQAARALAAIRCIAEATREASAGMIEEGETALACSGVDNPAPEDAADCWRAMHAASVLGEALRHGE